MTGLLPSTSGCYTDEPHHAATNLPDTRDIALWFREHGYHVTGGGKLYHHMPGFIDMRGWHDYFIWDPAHKESGWRLNSWHGPNAPLPAEVPSSPIAKYLHEQELKKNPNLNRERVNSHMEWGALANDDEEKMADTICTEWAADFLRQAKAPKGQPFFLGYGLYAPHKPNFVPQKYFDLYPLKALPVPRMAKGDLDDLPPIMRKRQQKRREKIDLPLRELKAGKKALQGYLAALSYADAMIGRVLDALEASPYAENTIIVLWSDNGYHLGEKGHWAKHTLWERTSNIPFLWAGPGIAEGEKVDTTVSLLDIYPTLTELCDLPENTEVEGHSLVSVLQQPATASDRTVLQINGQSVAAINSQYRYIRYDHGEEELYDVQADPDELTNLAESTDHADAKAAMAEHLPAAFAEPLKNPRDLFLKRDGVEFEWQVKKSKK